MLPSLLRSVGQLFGGDGGDGDGEGDELEGGAGISGAARALRQRRGQPLVVFESSSPAAARIARALALGRPVSLHAAVALPGVVPDADAGADPVRLNALPPAQRVAGVAAAGFTRRFGPLLVERASSLLVEPAPYVPAPPLRFLWTDLAGFGPASEAFARAVGVDARAFAAARARHSASAAVTAAAAAAAVPALAFASAPAGASLPHWLGQFDVKLVLETAVLPRDEALLPPQLRGILRRGFSAEGAPGYMPLLAANPVRPLRERFCALNASTRVLPLHVRFAPVSLGTWQLMRTLDASLSIQKDFGANDRDTDDVIRLVCDTPVWLLGLTFVISAVHLLFDMLALKSDVAFWSSSTSLRGLSVRALAVDFASQLVITAFLWSEGSSLLVLVPQALSNALGLWKLLRAFGIVWTLRWRVLPVPSFDARFASTAHEAGTARYDAEALAYLASLLAPLLLGFAVFQLLLVQHASWGSYMLSTAVSVVYGAGFALMIPQVLSLVARRQRHVSLRLAWRASGSALALAALPRLTRAHPFSLSQVYLNYKMRSVAALPWAVLSYR